MEITRDQIVSDLRKIGVYPGDHIAVGASFKSLGPVQGGPDGFIDALLEAVGPEGTLMMNTYTRVFYLAEVEFGWTDVVYDADTTKCTTGILSEKLRLREGAVRSRHPIMSNAAIGKHAHFLLDHHDETAESYSPYAKLAEVNGKYLAIGIGDHLKGFRHCAQQKAGLLNIVPWKRAANYRGPHGELKAFVLSDRGGCTTRLPDLVEHLRQEGALAEGDIGQAKTIHVPMMDSLEIMRRRLSEEPASYLCERPTCYWCRELENKLNLYGKIKDPKFFQKHGMIIWLMARLNHLRESDTRLATKVKLVLKKLLDK